MQQQAHQYHAFVMGRKRPRMAADATDTAMSSMKSASLSDTTPPPVISPQQQYFRYVLAPEDDGEKRNGGGKVNSDTSRNLRRAPHISRDRHQREVDKVDIPAPVEWLCHDAAASARLRAQAQTDLQLYVPRRPYQLPHSERQMHWLGDARIRAAIASTLNHSTGNDKPGHLRPERIIHGGEVLPWGTWPVRLRHHEGQCFYRDEGGGIGGSGSAPYWVGGGGAGRNGGVGGVGVVSEGSIHDELLRRQLPSSSSRHHEEVAVTRLVPDKRGRWVEAKPRRPPLANAAAAAAASASGSDASSHLILPTPSPPPSASLSLAPSTSAVEEIVECLIPARYGGWVECQENKKDRTGANFAQTQKRRAAVAMVARFGPDGGGGVDVSMTGVVPDAALPSSYLEEEEYVRRMVAATTTRETRRHQPGGVAQQQQQQQQQQQGARVSAAEERDQGGGGVATVGAERRRRKRSWDISANVGAGVGFGPGKADDNCDDSDRRRQGWTVSEPAKETVRRVWNRARRRARDSFESRHRAPEAADKGVEGGGAATTATDAGAGAGAGVNYGAIRDELDPDLLSCLGRECEGIIDAALHVVLGDRLRFLQLQSSTLSALTEENQQNDPPPPPTTADWQDVLRAMGSCSKGARGARPPVTTAAAFRSNAAAAHGQGREGGGVDGREGGQGVPGRGAMERAVWGGGSWSDGSVVVVNERLPGLPLNEAVLTRAYNRLLLYLHEKKTWQA